MTEALPPVSAPLPWQADNWSRVGQLLDSERLPHALLLAGPPGTGKERFALALARLLLCHRPEGGHNCGSCRACQMSAAGSHADYRHLLPEGKGRIIGIDAVRDMVAFVGKTASLGQRKVVLMSPADRMNVNAANALLKCLEEPARDTFLLLVCQRLHGLPATIRSRCQMLRFPNPPFEEGAKWLAHQTGDRQASEALLRLAGGRPLVAEQVQTDGSAESRAALAPALVALREGRDTPAALVEALWKDNSSEDCLAQLADYLREQLRNTDRAGLQDQRGRRTFDLLDEVTRWQRAVAAGSNPARELMLESLLGRVRNDLGAP